MSVRFDVIAIKTPLDWCNDKIKEFVGLNSRLVYSEKLHKKDAQNNIIYQKLKHLKADLNQAFSIEFKKDDQIVQLLVLKDNAEFQLEKMQQRGGNITGRPTKKKVCEPCKDQCSHIQVETQVQV